MKKFLCLLSICFIFIQCSKEKEPIYSNPEKPLVKNGFKVEVDEALKIAENAPNVFGEVDTKASLKEVGDIDIITTFETKGNGIKDTLMYVVNYKNQMGYTFISADDRCGGILAYIKEGNFKLKDESSDNLPTYLYTLIKNEQISKRLNINDPVEKSIKTKDLSRLNKRVYTPNMSSIHMGPVTPALCLRVFKQHSSYGDFKNFQGERKSYMYYRNNGCIGTRRYTETKVNVYPMLTTNWGQHSPYNDNAPLIDGKHALAGCVAIAAAQVMAYHEFPVNYPSNINNGEKTNLDILRNIKSISNFKLESSKESVAKFLRTLGDLYENSWGLDGTYSDTGMGSEVFEKMGYPRPCDIINYNTLRATNSLDNNRPIITRGNSGSNGHSWVIDGYITVTQGDDYLYFDEDLLLNDCDYGEVIYSVNTYLSCNFGWNGICNGYYLEGAFNVSEGNEYPYKTKTNYTQDIQIIPDIHK
ncbi:MAG: C10 family peptidase [Bacteroidetes bacterium]|nr:C10 family peptidase [Bacteroidota bacterium]